MSEYQENVLFIFPGQGSQYRGIGSDLHGQYEVARKVYDRASEALGYDVAELSFSDPEDRINLTRFTQPALLTHSVACLEVFRDRTEGAVVPSLVAGHSLGEYSAMVAAGVLSFEDALALVKKRGELMSEYGEGEMSAFPLDLETARRIAERHHCAVAGCNLPEQTVVGGRASDLELVEKDVLERFPRKRPVRLKTEGAFHTYYMVEAASLYREALEAADFRQAEIQVLSNCSGGLHEPQAVYMRSHLFFQLFRPVMWFENLQTAFAEGTEKVFEFGGGIGSGETPDEKRPNLEGIIKRAQRATGHKVEYQAVINQQTLDAAVDLVSAE